MVDIVHNPLHHLNHQEFGFPGGLLWRGVQEGI